MIFIADTFFAICEIIAVRVDKKLSYWFITITKISYERINVQEKIDRIKKIIADADAVIITAGAGMGVDSGLPDFRGDLGF